MESCIYLSKMNKVTHIENTKNKKISIIKSINFFLQNEIHVINKIKKIYEYEKYYNVWDSIEKINIGEFYEDSQYLQSIKTIQNEESLLIRYKYLPFVRLHEYLISLSCSRKYLFFLIEYYKKLLKCIFLLNEKNIVHNNITFNSILIDNVTEELFISDFSHVLDLTLDKKTYIESFFTFYKTNIYWPIEIHLLCFLNSNKSESLSLYNIETVISDVLKDNKVFSSFGLLNTCKEDGMQYFKKYVNQSYDYIVNDIWDYAFTWDQYSLSINYLIILIGLHNTVNCNHPFILSFMKYLIATLSFNPSKRELVEINKWEEMVCNIEAKNYHFLINKLSS